VPVVDEVWNYRKIGLSTDQALHLSAFAGFFFLGVYGATAATRQSRAGRRLLAFILAVPAAILMVIPGLVLLMAAAWLL
jgi:hypothetical protein